METARVVIIGGGAVGVSSLYHLAKAGWTDCVLLEKNELTAGSTWHAAGNCPTFSTSWAIMNMQRYSTELYRGLGAAVDYPMNYNVTGSIRLAHSKERMQEFQRACGMGRYQGMALDLLGPDEIKAQYPFIETHDIAGALHDPADGDIDPAQLTQALARGARTLGARIERFRPATGVSRDGRRLDRPYRKGRHPLRDRGERGRLLCAARGRMVPPLRRAHPADGGDEPPVSRLRGGARGARLVRRRGPQAAAPARRGRVLLPAAGEIRLQPRPLRTRGRAHWVTPDDPFPQDFSFQLYPDDLDRLEPYIADAMARVPVLGEAGLAKVINGPIPYAPDGNPLIGPMPGVPNAFEACVFTFGIAQAGGAGKVLAEWVTEGATEWDMWSCDPRRFTDFTDPAYCVEKAREVYGHEYAMHFPWHRWPAAPDRKVSPVHDRWWRWAARWAPMAGGSGRTGSPRPATTPPRPRPRPGAAPARGSRASARNASPCATMWACSTSPASRASTSQGRARATGSWADRGGLPRRAASASPISPTTGGGC
jgi:dimethylglycine dehydrogenase